ncbi:MAG TPA: heparinase II/III family protein [Rubrobacter sp.]|nr:heparinase II/III family protein [Rubrobacter sp.]
MHDPASIERALDETSPSPPFPPVPDRAAWQRAMKVIGEDQVSDLIAVADAYKEVPALPATLFLEFSRSGVREGYEQPANRRREMLSNLALAECLEDEGRFLDPLLDVAWAICEESSWSWPAHQGNLSDMDRPVIDLSAAMTALYLAELDLLLGDRLDPALGQRIRHEVDRRCLNPYLKRHDHWWLFDSPERPVNNWTAVCNAGVAGAATYLEADTARLAEILARAARSLDDYLSTFDQDGGSSEGTAYWSYGFGYYTVLAHLVGHRTDWKVDFFDGEFVRRIARFPARTQLSRGLYVNFSDCDRHASFISAHLAYLSRRLELPDLAHLAREQPCGGERERELTWALRSIFWRPELVEGSFVPARHDWFGGMMWMVSRQDPEDADSLVLATKGGHNGEMHNQNDVGNLIVHVGGESVIADIGRGRYTKSYFGPERYEHFANSSLGHSVPIPNGQVQVTGGEHGARLLEHRADHSSDLAAFELRDAYPPEAGLDSLTRTVVLHRGPPARIELRDEVRFTTVPGSFESALITFGDVDVSSDSVRLRGERVVLRVFFDPESVTPRVEVVEDVDLAEGPADVRRVVFAFPEPAKEGSVILRIEPEDRSAARPPG